MMGQRLTYWIFLGVIGFAVYSMLYSSISFNAKAPIQESPSTVEKRVTELSSQLGFSVDTLELMTSRTQHVEYFETIQDTIGQGITPGLLNSRGVNLTGWKVNIGTKQKEGETRNVDFLTQVGRLDILYDQQGKVRRISTYATNPNPTFVTGDSLSSIANHIIGDILEYDLRKYELSQMNVSDTVFSEGAKFSRQLDRPESRVGNNILFRWTKIDASELGPNRLYLEVRPIIREMNTSNMAEVKYGLAIEDFKALDPFEPEVLDSSNKIDNITIFKFFGSLALLAVLVFVLGTRYINKGQVEWKRALIVLTTVGVAILLWRVIYLLNSAQVFMNSTSTALYMLNNLIFAGVGGLYAALAYIGWEAIARTRSQEQLKLIDAFWRKRIFFRETGEGLIRGYALGGILLGLFAVGLYLFNAGYYQSDSQYGFTEAIMQPKILTLNLSALINVSLVSLGHVGVTVGFLQSKVSNKWWFYGLGVVLLGFFLAGSANLVSVTGPGWYDIVIFIAMSAAIIYAYNSTGLLTFSTAWWIFIMTMLIMPYWHSSNLVIAYVAWVQMIVLIIPLAFGFIAYKYGNSVSELEGYVPEYQEKMANHLRVEKEIEIARESQFKLMPLQPPVLEEVDVYGFFMPSFEVGGDYFDYIVSDNGVEDSKVLNMTIADVSGKSMKAAMHAVFTSGLLLSRLHRDAPEAILSEIAPTLHTRTDPKTFITCIIAQYHLKEKKIRIANAGHCLPILKRNGKAEFIQTPEPKFPLGIRSMVPYQALDLDLKKGDFLLLYSDGLPEAVSPTGERFGFDNILSLVEKLDTDQKTSNEIAMEIKRRVQKFSDYQLADDTTIISLKV